MIESLKEAIVNRERTELGVLKLGYFGKTIF